MKHAGALALDQLDDLLSALRLLPGPKERTRGVFYLRAKAFLHFHEDPAGLFADLRRDGDFERFPVNTSADRAALLKAVRSVLDAAGE
jgi:hypothetical protein